MEQELTLNRAWDLCLNGQWKWIIKQLDAGSKISVTVLKKEWTKEYGHKGIFNDCFFCQYDLKNRLDDRNSCKKCPAKIMSSRFNCMTAAYHYLYKPHKFYAKLVKLNEKRKKKVR